MDIKLLSPLTISRIAAGEVIVNPAAVIKELIENSIDAGSTEISLLINQTGRNLISITDNGRGMSKEDLFIAADRHTTSKLNEEDIFNIEYFGFRGEALPSIGAVSRLNITSRTSNDDMAWSVDIIGGDKSELYPASLSLGTKIEVRDLFFATPARLKFLKAEKTELQYIIDIINKIALANHNISLGLASENRVILKYEAQENKLDRVKQIFGNVFAENLVEINEIHNDIKIYGFVSLPTFNRATVSEQHFFVNNRPVRDKLLSVAVKIAYQELIDSSRYPIIVLFLDLPPDEVGVNVHPTKAEVRFRDTNNIRSIVVNATKAALSIAGSSSDIANKFITDINRKNIASSFYQVNTTNQNSANIAEKDQNYIHPIKANIPLQQNFFLKKSLEPVVRAFEVVNEDDKLASFPLGSAKCQLHELYIISQTTEGIVITDQHAAHERLVYEKLKAAQTGSVIRRQRLLIPEIVTLSEKHSNKIIEIKEELEKFGLFIEKFGSNIIVNEIPGFMTIEIIKQVINDIADELIEYDANFSLPKLQQHILKTFACHHSVRSGKKLNIVEMNALLREIESTDNSAQCNHGRPAYIKLKLTEIEKLFDRS